MFDLSNLESYGQQIPDSNEFNQMRETWRKLIGVDEALRSQAIELVIASNRYNYGYQWEWCGVPIIRHPDDIVLQQEIMWKMRPTRVVESGVARGGSLALSASLMLIIGLTPRVLGIDIQILPHTLESLRNWINQGSIELFENDSISHSAASKVSEFLTDSTGPALLVLDSNHSHDHVLSELNSLAPLLPVDSVIIVADTIIEEMPLDHYPNRPWGRGNNPYTAVQTFLNLNSDFELDKSWARRSLTGEFRDGVLRRVK